MKRKIRRGDIAPFCEFVPDAIDVAVATGLNIQQAEVPNELRPLVRFVNRWGVSGAPNRAAFANYCRQVEPEYLEEFLAEFSKRIVIVVSWLTEIRSKHELGSYPPAADAFINAKLAYLEVAPPSFPDGY